MEPTIIRNVHEDQPSRFAKEGDTILIYQDRAGLWRPLTIREAMEHLTKPSPLDRQSPRYRRGLSIL